MPSAVERCPTCGMPRDHVRCVDPFHPTADEVLAWLAVISAIAAVGHENGHSDE